MAVSKYQGSRGHPGEAEQKSFHLGSSVEEERYGWGVFKEERPTLSPSGGENDRYQGQSLRKHILRKRLQTGEGSICLRAAARHLGKLSELGIPQHPLKN